MRFHRVKLWRQTVSLYAQRGIIHRDASSRGPKCSLPGTPQRLTFGIAKCGLPSDGKRAAMTASDVIETIYVAHPELKIRSELELSVARNQAIRGQASTGEERRLANTHGSRQ